MSKQEEMYHLVSEYRQSGQSAKSFCAANQIRPSTFQYWIRKERQEKISAFIPIKTGSAYPGQNIIELIYPNGVRLCIGNFDLDQISKLIKLQ